MSSKVKTVEKLKPGQFLLELTDFDVEGDFGSDQLLHFVAIWFLHSALSAPHRRTEKISLGSLTASVTSVTGRL